MDRETPFTIIVTPPDCLTLTWEEPTNNPPEIPINTQTEWSSVSDKLIELDGNGDSWSDILGTAEISVINGPSFISVVGTTIRFNPTVAGTYSYTVK